MTAAAATVGREKKASRVDPLDCFIVRCDARAYLWHAGEYGLHEAVDVLQHAAERDRLIKHIGQDAVQEIIADAFRPFHELTNVNGGDVPEPSTLAAECYASTSVSGRGQPSFPNRVAPFAPPSTEPEQTKRRPTPESTIKAVVHCVRERGIAALQEPANKERLARCDDAAQAQIRRRIAKLREQS